MTPPVDDGTVGNDEPLWRRIPPHLEGWVRVVDGVLRPTSMAFLDNTNDHHELSVHRQGLTDVATIRNRFTSVGLASVLASVPRALNHAVAADPMPDDVSHALVIPAEMPGGRRKAAARTMAERSVWVVLPGAADPSGDATG